LSLAPSQHDAARRSPADIIEQPTPSRMRRPASGNWQPLPPRCAVREAEKLESETRAAVRRSVTVREEARALVPPSPSKSAEPFAAPAQRSSVAASRGSPSQRTSLASSSHPPSRHWAMSDWACPPESELGNGHPARSRQPTLVESEVDDGQQPRSRQPTLLGQEGEDWQDPTVLVAGGSSPDSSPTTFAARGGGSRRKTSPTISASSPLQAPAEIASQRRHTVATNEVQGLCHGCGTPISSNAAHCRKCGALQPLEDVGDGDSDADSSYWMDHSPVQEDPALQESARARRGPK